KTDAVRIFKLYAFDCVLPFSVLRDFSPPRSSRSYLVSIERCLAYKFLVHKVSIFYYWVLLYAKYQAAIFLPCLLNVSRKLRFHAWQIFDNSGSSSGIR